MLDRFYIGSIFPYSLLSTNKFRVLGLRSQGLGARLLGRKFWALGVKGLGVGFSQEDHLHNPPRG